MCKDRQWWHFYSVCPICWCGGCLDFSGSGPGWQLFYRGFLHQAHLGARSPWKSQTNTTTLSHVAGRGLITKHAEEGQKKGSAVPQTDGPRGWRCQDPDTRGLKRFTQQPARQSAALHIHDRINMHVVKNTLKTLIISARLWHHCQSVLNASMQHQRRDAFCIHPQRDIETPLTNQLHQMTLGFIFCPTIDCSYEPGREVKPIKGNIIDFISPVGWKEPV